MVFRFFSNILSSKNKRKLDYFNKQNFSEFLSGLAQSFQTP